MAKTNIIFNNTNYSIEESALAPATAELKSHLQTSMNGSGEVINLGGVPYNVDATKLSTLKNEFVSHLGTIAGEGYKVVVGENNYFVDSNKVQSAVSELHSVLSGFGEERLGGDGAEFYTLAPTALSFRSTAPLNELQEIQINGVTVDPSNYTLEEGSTIVTFPIDYLKTLNVGSYEVAVASDSKTVKGDFTVAAPELNEHGFYYNQPYSAYVDMFSAKLVFFVREDGTADTIFPEYGNTETVTYVIDGDNVVFTSSTGDYHCIVSSDGNEIYCNEFATNFDLDDESISADGDYIYIYKEDLGGYEVTAIDKTKAEYGAIKTGVNGIDTVKLADEAFVEVVNNDTQQNPNLIRVPEIPNTVVSIGALAFSGCSALMSATIPDSVISISNYAFKNCDSLTSITIPDSVTSIGDYAFEGCEGITSIVIGDSVASIGRSAFYYCNSLDNIIFNGTTSQWNAITKGYDWNTEVPATHVQCSDGQVAL